MTQMGRLLLILGAALAGVGLVLWLLGKAGFRGLPGDLRYESNHVKVYFPIVTCIVLSILLTGGMWLLNVLRNWWQR